jgi:preprotein translocase subunit SecG
MDWKSILTVVQIILSIGIVISILVQNRGEGLGSFFGGGGEIFRTRRGVENVLYYITIGLSVLLVAISLFNTTLS